MSPLAARRLVGQPDIVERLHKYNQVGGYGLPELRRDAADEIENLRAVLRAVRASTDPRWQAQIISDALRETKP
jgi:hypothetical protein